MTMIKKIFFGLIFVAALTACTDDYKDWAQIPTTPQPETVAFGDGSVTEMGVIDLNAVTDENVQVCSIKAPSASDAAYTPSYTITIGDETYNIDANGAMSAAELQAIIADNFGRRPVQREVEATVSMWLSNGTTAVKTATSAPFKLRVIPQAPEVEQAYYVTGSINGWDNTNTSYKLTNDGSDPYENPTFTCRIPAPEDGSSVEFKMTPESGLGGDWSKCLAAGSAAGTFVYNNGGGNLVIEAVPGAKYYDLTFNMMELTWSYKAVAFEQFVYFIGATDGWANAEQKLALADESGVYTGYLYVADPNGWGVEFKFQKVPGDWDSQLNSNNLNEISGGFAKGGDNIVAADGVGVYYVTLDMAKLTLNAVKVEKMGIIGDFNGWGGDVEMTWNAADYCFEATNAGVNANGWKFRVNSDWGINLGGDTLDNLVANGANLSAVGNSIKLYPTRKTSDNIYCTVE